MTNPDVKVSISLSDLKEIRDCLVEVKQLANKLIAEKETYRDFLGERGLTDEYKQWLKANNWNGV